jgi:hypothetical protein
MPCCGKISAAYIETLTPKRDAANLLAAAKRRSDTIERVSVDQVNEIGWATHDHVVGNKDCDGNVTRAGQVATEAGRGAK